MKTIAVIGGSQEQTYQSIGYELGLGYRQHFDIKPTLIHFLP
ncbi:hypothetical protein [Halalkalibacter oceani]|nr:hypothetical protein [Halalkalibacter oceani]